MLTEAIKQLTELNTTMNNVESSLTCLIFISLFIFINLIFRK